MSEAIIVAIIGAAGVIIAALINAFCNKHGNKKIVKQKAKGNNNTQIGFQIQKGHSDKQDGDNK